MHLSRREVMTGAVAGIGGAMGRRAAAAAPREILNDASRLNPTPVFKHARIAGTDETAIAAIRAELKAAAAAGRPVTLGAARHSMGGQSLSRDGTAITLDGRALAADTAAGVYRVAAGTRWSEVIAQLDPLGFSPLVMQSNSDFGLASTFCVNAHGWAVPHGPFGSTVRALRMILADGTLVTCSPHENADLFGAAMGGYGLFGVIVDIDVEMTRNRLLKPTSERLDAGQFVAPFMRAVEDPNVEMAYGRLSVARGNFFDEALLVSYRATPNPPTSLPPVSRVTPLTDITRDLYRSQIGYELIKKVRWAAETRLTPLLTEGIATRNTLMDEPVANLRNEDPRRTDILHEYFVSPLRFAEFLALCREIIPKARAEFLNVTLRYVAADPMSVLAYAPTPRIAAVMSFSQEISPDGEIDMMTMTERLIDGVLAVGGAFYLPYRLHARRDQVLQAYPNRDAFVALKRRLDPKLLFQNALWTTYLA